MELKNRNISQNLQRLGLSFRQLCRKLGLWFSRRVQMFPGSWQVVYQTWNIKEYAMQATRLRREVTLNTFTNSKILLL